MGNSKKKHSVTHFLIGSFIGLIVFSIMVFSMLGIYMSRKSNKAIKDVYKRQVLHSFKKMAVSICCLIFKAVCRGAGQAMNAG